MADAPHVMIVEARFYEDIADELVKGAVRALDAAGATYDRYEVPGAFEIPAAIKFAFRAGQIDKTRRPFDGYVALGCVIRGETTHYDYVCEESARGLQDLALQHDLAIGYGILTVEDDGQAWAQRRGRRNRQGRSRGAGLPRHDRSQAPLSSAAGLR